MEKIKDNSNKKYAKYQKYILSKKNKKEICDIPMTKSRFLEYLNKEYDKIHIDTKQTVDKFCEIWG